MAFVLYTALLVYVSAGHVGVDRIGSEADRIGGSISPLTRVQTSVLRKKLAAYYAGPGLADQIVVSLPKGHYVPEFERRVPELSESMPPPKSSLLLWLGVGGGAVLLLLNRLGFRIPSCSILVREQHDRIGSCDKASLAKRCF
jgi:hypothetical protein